MPTDPENPGLPDRRQLILGGVLLASAFGAIAARPRARPFDLAADRLAAGVPEQIGPYRHREGDAMILPERDVDSLAVYQQYVARTFAAPGLPPVALLIAYGAAQDYALQIHRPESCYPPAGFALGRSHAVPVQLPAVGRIDAVALSARRLDRIDQLLYWTRIGDAFPASVWAQRGTMIRQLLDRHVPDGVLVRLSTPGEGDEAIGRLIRFNALLLASIGPLSRRLLLGVSRPGATA